MFVGGPPNYSLTGDFTIPSGRTLQVENRLDMRGVRLTVAGTLALDGTIRMSNVNGVESRIVVQGPAGTFKGIAGTDNVFNAAVECDTGSEVIADGAGAVVDKVNISIPMQCQGACFLAKNGGTVRFGAGTQTFSGGAFFAANTGGVIDVPAGATLRSEASAGTIQVGSGARFRMGSGAGLAFYGPVNMAGTSASPVRVERASSGQAWGSLTLYAPGNTLEYVVLDGGYKNVEVRSRTNSLRNVTSRSGWRNLSTGTNYSGGGRSAVGLYKVLLEGATTVGAALYDTDATVSNSVVRNNGEAGVYVSNAAVATFYQNEVYGNGATSSTRDGVEVYSGGSVTMTNGSRNVVRDNAGDGVYLSGSGRLYAGKRTCPSSSSCFGDGQNVFSDGPAAASVRNSSSYAVDAEGNYWGASSPQSHWVYGTVDYTPYLTSAPSGTGAGTGVGAAATASPVLAVSQGALTPGPAAGSWETFGKEKGPSAAAPDPLPDAAVGPLGDEIRAVRAALAEAAATAEAAPLAVRLYYLHGLDPADRTGERRATRTAFAEYRAGGGAQKKVARELAERAALVALDEALAEGRTADARALLGGLGKAKPSEAGARAELAAARVEVLRREGRYRDALAALADGAEALGEGYVAVVAADLEEEAEGGAVGTGPVGARTSGASAGATAGAPVEAAVAAAVPVALYETGLAAPYPNPAAGAVTVPVTLADEAEVEVLVFDALGREVARLAGGRLGAGRHPLALDGRELPPGLYVVRATVTGADGAPASFVRRVTIAH